MQVCMQNQTDSLPGFLELDAVNEVFTYVCNGSVAESGCTLWPHSLLQLSVAAVVSFFQTISALAFSTA